MSDSIRTSIYEALASIRLIDPHTHINPHAAGSSTLADILGYHYYTELIHASGMPREVIEKDSLSPRELVGQLVTGLGAIENTANYRWLIELCRMFFGFDGDRIDASNWETLYDTAESRMQTADWAQVVLDQSNVESVFLTNDFDDSLEGFDSGTYIPCLRTDELVFHLAKPAVRERLAACSQVDLIDLASLREALRRRFEHFVGRGARACAISLPPSFQPAAVNDGRAATALENVLRHGLAADAAHRDALARRVFWTLAELCDEFNLPFDLMIGVNRGVYPGGVYQGQDLYDSRVSLIQYRELFNSFPGVKFPVSVLASVTNQELVDYAWIFPNVYTNGHWWYSNTPSIIARDAAARLEAVPQTKQIAYYSDAYKLEFVWPKFDMYRQVLAGVLADHFVRFNGWTEDQAIALGRRSLRDNVDELFPLPSQASAGSPTPLVGTAGMDAESGAGEIGDDLFVSTVVDTDGEQGESDSDDDGPMTIADVPGVAFESATESGTLGSTDSESIEFDLAATEISGSERLDPLPSTDEINLSGAADVDVFASEASTEVPTAESIAAEVDDDSLDVGDLTGDDFAADSPTDEGDAKKDGST